jgi:hypothetical protein
MKAGTNRALNSYSSMYFENFTEYHRYWQDPLGAHSQGALVERQQIIVPVAISMGS